MAVRIYLITTLSAFLLAGCISSQGVYHPVAAGQTLYSISRAYDVDESYLARINRIEDVNLLQIGQRLYIPGADRVQSIDSSMDASRSQKRKTKASRSPPASSTSPPDIAASPSAPAKKASTPSVTPGTFSWPLKGKLFKKFAGSSGAPSKGIEIAAAEGTPVHSSAAGQVIYNGNGIRGYGNLIILKHARSFFTVYGFNSKSLVEDGAFVGKGQRIALSGVPPGGPPRLHFEIRYGKKAVDPIFYLP